MSRSDVRVRSKDSALIPATHSAVVGSGDAPLPVVADGQISVTGTGGLPLITRVGGLLRIEFLRRKATTNSGITYEPQFSETLLDPWSPSTATPTIIDIDSTWERVLIEDDQPSATKRFARVRVSYTQP